MKKKILGMLILMVCVSLTVFAQGAKELLASSRMEFTLRQ